MNNKIIVLNLVFLVLFNFVLISEATVFDYTVEPDSNDTFETAEFRIYVSDTIDVVRGVYFYLRGYGQSSKHIVYYSNYQEICNEQEFFLMGAMLDNMHMESGIGEAVLTALDTFAVMTDHPEMQYSPIFFDGHSWGGQFAYHFTKWEPERVVSFMTQKGGCHDTTFAGDGIEVPGYLIVGEFDYLYRIENLTGIFEEHRPLGALWCLAMHPNAGHGRVGGIGKDDEQELIDNYFRDMVELRVPEVIDPYEPIELITIDESLGWLGQRDTFWIGDYPCYTPEVDSASWFGTREIAQRWQGFVSENTVTDTFPCDPAGIQVESPQSPPSHFKISQNYPNPFNPTTTIKYQLKKTGNISLKIYDTMGRLVKTLVDGKKKSGYHSVQWEAVDDRGEPVPSGIYYYRLSADDIQETRKMILLK